LAKNFYSYEKRQQELKKQKKKQDKMKKRLEKKKNNDDELQIENQPESISMVNAQSEDI